MDVVDKIKAGTQANNGAVTNPDKIVSMRWPDREIAEEFHDMSAGNTLTLETTKGPVVIELNPASRRTTSPTSRSSSPRAFTTASCSTG